MDLSHLLDASTWGKVGVCLLPGALCLGLPVSPGDALEFVTHAQEMSALGVSPTP